MGYLACDLGDRFLALGGRGDLNVPASSLLRKRLRTQNAPGHPELSSIRC
jgi:hypothetical protein